MSLSLYPTMQIRRQDDPAAIDPVQYEVLGMAHGSAEIRRLEGRWRIRLRNRKWRKELAERFDTAEGALAFLSTRLDTYYPVVLAHRFIEPIEATDVVVAGREFRLRFVRVDGDPAAPFDPNVVTITVDAIDGREFYPCQHTFSKATLGKDDLVLSALRETAERAIRGEADGTIGYA